MGRSKSSGRWIERQLKDTYVRRAQAQGYRSRAAFKLLEIQEKDRIIKPRSVIVDLGAAPGGWSQVARELVGDHGAVFALDRLPMEPIAGVHVVQGDFREDDILQQLMRALGDRSVDLVLCDMAPNLSGVKAVDQPRSMYLSELALAFVDEVLVRGGSLLVKVFQGEGFDSYIKVLREQFGEVVTRKPAASRRNNREVYVVARNYDS